ncbi:uncharacterized protein METZ01_LOCUS137929, partial [marine metagenome]
MKQWQIFLMAGLFLAVCNSLGDAEAASPVTLETDIDSANVLEGDYIMATLTLTNTNIEFRKQEVYLVINWPTNISWATQFVDTNGDLLEDNMLSLGKQEETTIWLQIFCYDVCEAGDTNTFQVYGQTDPRFYKGDGNATDNCGSDDCET